LIQTSIQNSKLIHNKPFDIVIDITGDLDLPSEITAKIIPEKHSLESRKPTYNLTRKTITNNTSRLIFPNLSNSAITPEKEETDVLLWIAVKNELGKTLTNWKRAILYRSELPESSSDYLFPNSYVNYHTHNGNYSEIVFYMKDRNGKILEEDTPVTFDVKHVNTKGLETRNTEIHRVGFNGRITIVPFMYLDTKSYTFRIKDANLATFQVDETELVLNNPPPLNWQRDSPIKASPIRAIKQYTKSTDQHSRHNSAVWHFETSDGTPWQKGTQILFDVTHVRNNGTTEQSTTSKQIDKNGKIILIPFIYLDTKSYTYRINRTLNSHNVYRGTRAQLVIKMD